MLVDINITRLLSSCALSGSEFLCVPVCVCVCGVCACGGFIVLRKYNKEPGTEQSM